MQVTIAAGLQIGYDLVGQGNVVVWLHAFPLTRAMWRPQWQGLADVARSLAVDLRGFGESGPFTETPAVERMAQDVHEVLDALAIREPVVLAGLSMGGYVALAFARKYPQQLRGLILADTKAEPDDAVARENRQKMIAFASENSPTAVVESMLPRLLGEWTRTHRPEVSAEVRRIAAEQSISGIIAALQALRDRPDATPGLSDIRVPTLVVVGQEDIITPPSVAEQLASQIQGAKCVTVAHAGHLANLEQPDAFNQAVREFLTRL